MTQSPGGKKKKRVRVRWPEGKMTFSNSLYFLKGREGRNGEVMGKVQSSPCPLQT